MSDAAARIRRWREEPVTFVVDNFGVEPDAWQVDALSALGGAPNPRRMLAMKACTGPGKSAVLSWIGWHRLACFAAPGEHPKGAALSATADNLRDNLWPELAKWQARSPFLSSAFKWTKQRIYALDHPETWFLAARSFAQDADEEAIGNALSGLHGQFPFVLLDETGGMPVAVGKKAQQIFTGNPTDALIAQAGNPTDMAGLLYDSCTTFAHLWRIITITADPDDPKRTPRVSIEHAREMIATYGRENPWVMATILGQFPASALNKLLGPQEVAEAMRRQPRDADWRRLARILGVDVARFGLDASVVAKRAGPVIMPLQDRRNLSSIPGAGWVASQFNGFFDDGTPGRADQIFVDETGGYGAGWIDQLRTMNYPVTGVVFSGAADDPRFYNKRAEMYWRLAEAIKSGGLCLPNDPLLAAELVAPRYWFHKDRMQLEDKEQIKATLGRSPDRADAVALTFAFTVWPGPREHEVPAGGAAPPIGAGALDSAVRQSYASPVTAGVPGGVYNPME